MKKHNKPHTLLMKLQEPEGHCCERNVRRGALFVIIQVKALENIFILSDYSYQHLAVMFPSNRKIIPAHIPAGFIIIVTAAQ